MEREGVIKFDLEYSQQDLSGVLAETDISELIVWRQILVQLRLVGCSPLRYDGLGFGNVSMRTPAGFLISGSQTGHLEQVGANDFAEVIGWDTGSNRVKAQGAVKPSSESLTHAAIYDLSERVRFVFHVHDPDIWSHAKALHLAETDAGVPYGTPAMAQEVARIATPEKLPCVFSMAGHTDGVVAFGDDAIATGLALVRLLAGARVFSAGQICPWREIES